MELPLKRKRNVVLKIEDNDSDEIITSDDEKDDDFIPPAKKTKSVPKPKVPKVPKTKQVKIKKESEKRIKAVKKKVSKAKGLSIKAEENSEIPIINNDKMVNIKKESNAISKINHIEESSSCTVNNAKVEKLVEETVLEARKQCQPWKDEEVVAESSHVPVDVARNVISLLTQECTIPFIVRYRREMTGGLQAEKLREVQEAYEEVKHVHKKVDSILKSIKDEKFDVKLATSFLYAKTLDEVELLYAPFKPGSKKSLAERSKLLGLEPLALQLMESKIPLQSININSLIKPQKGLENEKEILSGIQHIIADKISKDRKVLDCIKKMSNHRQILIMSSKTLSADKADKAAFVEGKSTQNFKYENYFELNIPLNNVAPHQVMALNRGEKQKVLKVKIQIPILVKNEIIQFIWSTLFSGNKNTYDYLKNCVEDAYERLIEPYMIRQIRSELTKKAERESISVFGSNVRSLLLTPPVRGKTVLGIDPGFTHGCKIAVVSSKGKVLGTEVIYPHTKNKCKYQPDAEAEKILRLISSHGVDVIAVGNGTACRETEVWLSGLIKSQFFHPFLIKYCIVNENGVSIYSVTKEAEAELPGMDPNLRSAVSIARRLQDPLLEYVKVEPKHLGVGMYQHDVSESQLKKALDSIVEECVSFVGVDLNVCSELLLRKISGLSASRAKKIVEWRETNGCFVNRQQLLDVKGLGQKSYEQCAGFVKILPGTCVSHRVVPASKSSKTNKVETTNPLDRTIIHPESYNIAQKFLQEINADVSMVGQQALIDKVNSYLKFQTVEDVANKFSTTVAVMQLIIDAFKQLLDYDIRAEFDQPLFLTSVRTFSDLQANQELTGRVTNVTSFGAFVDIGVESNGLIHVSKMKSRKLNVGDRVTVKVIDISIQKKRIGLELVL